MATEPKNDFRDLWQSQSTEGYQMSVDEIHRRIEAVNEKIREETRAGILAGIALFAAFVWSLFLFPNTLQRAGAVMTLLGLAFLVLQSHRLLKADRAARAAEAERGSAGSIEFHRAQLERIRDNHRGETFWSRLLVITPGPLVFMIGFLLAYPKITTFILIPLISFLVIVPLIIPLNLAMARKFQQRIDELDALRKEQ